jgi:hypothetical protein
MKGAQRAPSEPPLHEDEELPTKVGQSISLDAMPSAPPTGGVPKVNKDEEEEEDVTRVRAPEDDLLQAAAQAAMAGPGAPARPSPIPPAPDSGHTLMMPPGGGGIPMPASSPEPPLMQPPPPPAPGTALPLGANMLPAQHGGGPHGGLGSTVAIAHGGALGALASAGPGQPSGQQNPAVLSGISDLRPTPYQPLQQPPPGYPQPFPGGGTPQMGVPAHFQQAQAPAQFQTSGYPTGAHAPPASAQPQQGGGKAPLGLIIAAVAFLVLGIGGLTVFFLMGRNPGSTEAGNGTPSAVPTPVPVPSPSPTPVVTAPPVVDPNGTPTAPVADNSAGTAPTGAPTETAPTPTQTAAPTNNAPTPVNPGPTAVNPGPTAVNPGPTPVNPGPTAMPKPVPSAAPAVDPNAWNEGAARARLAQANGVLVFCKKPDEPTGPGSASVTFSPEGTVSSVTLDPPYAGTKAGDCVAGQFKRAKVNAFQGSSQTIKHSFDVPK